MEQRGRTIGSLSNQNAQFNTQQERDWQAQELRRVDPGYHAFIDLLGQNAARCFPIDRIDETIVNSVNTDNVAAVTKLYVFLAKIADQTWDRYASSVSSSDQEQQTQQPSQQSQSHVNQLRKAM